MQADPLCITVGRIRIKIIKGGNYFEKTNITQYHIERFYGVCRRIRRSAVSRLK